MSAQAIVIIVLVGVVAAVVAAVVLWRANRRRRLQDWFGPEYDLAVEEAGSRRAAEAELVAREKRHDTLDIRPLDSQTRERYADQWAAVQERFVDDPDSAVTQARELVTAVMDDRGYPVDTDDEQQMADLSVEHGRTVSQYRDAVSVSARAEAGEATTEELRLAMVHYRALFAELLDAGSPDSRGDDTAGSHDSDPETTTDDDIPVPGEYRTSVQ